jgi:DNA-binding transcriptional LysR family regulator
LIRNAVNGGGVVWHEAAVIFGLAVGFAGMRARIRVQRDRHVAIGRRCPEFIVNGMVDIGIGSSASSSDVETPPYLRDRLVLIVPPHHPLAKVTSMRFVDALDHKIIGLPERSGVQMFIRRIEQNGRKPLRISVTVSSNEVLRTMVETGIGISMISEQVASVYLQTSAIRVIPLKDKSVALDIRICVASLRELPAHATAFVELLRTRAEQME